MHNDIWVLLFIAIGFVLMAYNLRKLKQNDKENEGGDGEA